jgi:uncharacterized protein
LFQDEIGKRLKEENPWWTTWSIDTDYKAMPRRLYFDLIYNLVKPIENRRALVLMGPRRVGKTVILNQTIQRLMDDGIPAKKIVFISVDAPIYNQISLENLFEMARAVSGEAEWDGYYVMFDEIQYLRNWEVHLKSMVDKYRRTKFVVSGSAAAALKLKSNESGAGRFTDFTLPPLTFQEFLVLSNKDDLMTTESIHWNDSEMMISSSEDINLINEYFVQYINRGGFPENIFNSFVAGNPSRYLKNDIVDKVLLRDLPSLYGIEDVQELNGLFNVLAYNTADEFTFEALNKSSGVAKPTIKRYLEYLEAAFLIKRVNRIDMAGKKFQRANYFKVYITNPSLRSALFSQLASDDPAMGNLVETAIVSQWFHRQDPVFYARWQRKTSDSQEQDGEVDIVGLNERLKPAFAIEVKWSDRYVEKTNELKSLVSFMKHNDIKSAIVTTKTIRATKVIDGITLQFVPSAYYAHVVGKNSLELNYARSY